MCGGAGILFGRPEVSGIAVSNQAIASAAGDLVTILPEAVLTRGRMGFGAPIEEWPRGGLSDGLGGHTPRADELPDPAFIGVTATLHDVIFPNYWFERWASG